MLPLDLRLFFPLRSINIREQERVEHGVQLLVFTASLMPSQRIVILNCKMIYERPFLDG